MFTIEGLMQYLVPHKSIPPQKEKIKLKNPIIFTKIIGFFK